MALEVRGSGQFQDFSFIWDDVEDLVDFIALELDEASDEEVASFLLAIKAYYEGRTE